MFKKICVAFLVLFLTLPMSVFAIDWFSANSSVITWSAVTTLENGEPILHTGYISYSVWLALEADTAREDAIELGVTTDLTYVVTMAEEGKYFVGLQSIRNTSDGLLICKSRIGWSDEPEIVADGVTFGLSYYYPPAMVQELRCN